MWRAGSKAGQGGFTLLELLVVLVIAAAGAALILPNLGGGMAALEIRGAARELASALRFARGQAIAERGPAALTLDVEAKRYRLSGRERDYELPSGIDLKLLTGRSELLDENAGRITFFPDGSATGGRITLSAGRQRYVVDVNWLTGRVSIFE